MKLSSMALGSGAALAMLTLFANAALAEYGGYGGYYGSDGGYGGSGERSPAGGGVGANTSCNLHVAASCATANQGEGGRHRDGMGTGWQPGYPYEQRN
jgi:hypothetical protein